MKISKFSKIRLQADLSYEVSVALKNLALDQNISLSKALARAISTEFALMKRRKQGAKVILHENNKFSEIIFV